MTAHTTTTTPKYGSFLLGFLSVCCCWILPLVTAATISAGDTAVATPTTDVVAQRNDRSMIVNGNELENSTARQGVSELGGQKGTNDVEYLAGLYGYRARYRPQLFSFHKEGTNVQPSSPPILNLITSEEGADICKEHCVCAREKNAFRTISCDFQSNPQLSEIFGSNLKIPSDVTAITIKLGPKTNFRLERGFFNNNTVNSLMIEGTNRNSEQVEITPGAFQGNNGPYPEITLSNIYSVVVRERAISGNAKFTVRNSNDLILYPNAFESAKVNGLFVGIKDLRIEEKAFNSAQAKLTIESSHIDNIYRFEASLREIRFVNCSIGTINGGTFDVININSIVFENCRIDVIKSRAITEKLYSKHVSITGAIIGSIEGEAIYGSGINELLLTRNNIDTIHENAIHVTAINASISYNNIKHLGDNWLRVKEWSNIIVEKNQFGDFGRIMLEETKQPVTCRFDGNSVTRPKPGSLNITNSYCLLRDISVDIPCRCNLDWLQKLSAHDLRSETYCTIDDKLGHCFNSTTFNTLKYLNEVCDESKTILDCGANRNLKKMNGHFFTPEELERQKTFSASKTFWILIILGALLVIFCFISIIAYCCRKRRIAARMQCSHNHEFSNIQRQIIDQSLRTMQKKYPKIYGPVYERIQIIMQENLPESKCVKAISQIEDYLNKANINDFVELNQLLSQHLQPQTPTAPTEENFYNEPEERPDLDNAATPSNTFVPMPLERYDHENETNRVTNDLSSEHVYSVPLLNNEYGEPLDKDSATAATYTEPVYTRDGNLMNSTAMPHHNQPYAIAGNRNPSIANRQPAAFQPYAVSGNILPPAAPKAAAHLPPYATPNRNKTKPSTTLSNRAPQNLPDVLYQSQVPNQSQEPFAHSSHAASPKPHTSVKQLAQNLQNMPKFNPNQPPPRNYHLLAPPSYEMTIAADQNRHQFQFLEAGARLATPERDDSELEGAAALPPGNESDHSGASKETLKIDDVIDYIDTDTRK